ncbi:MAG: hypothetical protein GTO03_09245 [Planctomycetales bacterium]|nr:hypothetical protein [Planctomycetales bacterium]
MSIKRLILFAVVAVAVLLVAFEPSVQNAIKGLWQEEVVDYARPDWQPPGTQPINKVYLPRGGTYYHRKDCPHMQRQGVVIPLEKARELAKPCPYCGPPQ